MAKEQDQSMEEILQSIKRIIAEEGEPPASGSDVLELTDLLDDGAEPAAEGNASTLSIDDLMNTPVEPEFTPTVAAKPEPQPAPAPAPVVETPAPVADEGLAAQATIAASADALAALKNMPQPTLPPLPPSGVGFRSGTTIEDLVLEGLRPMLKDWLDANLTGIVERLVEKEIRRLNAR